MTGFWITYIWVLKISDTVTAILKRGTVRLCHILLTVYLYKAGVMCFSSIQNSDIRDPKFSYIYLIYIKCSNI